MTAPDNKKSVTLPYLFNKIYNFQVGCFNEQHHRTIRFANLVCFLTILISSLYSLYYYSILHCPRAALFNQLFILPYLTYYGLLYRGRLSSALLTIITTFLLQVFVFVIFFASSRSGIHYYYLVSVPTIFFILKKKKGIYRFSFSFAAIVLFIICEVAGDRFSSLILGDTHFNILYCFTLANVSIVLLITSYTFNKEIDERENKLQKTSGDLVLSNLVLEEENRERRLAQESLEKEKIKLQKALAEIKQLSGLLPICASCKKIRDDQGYWSQIETYIAEHSEAEFSHGLCPDCGKKLYPELYED